jgi:predicted nuclease of predicted toxin-antitoxin system
MGNADDGVIARHARENTFCLITRDKDFGDIRNYPPGDYGGIIVLDDGNAARVAGAILPSSFISLIKHGLGRDNLEV